MQPLHNRVQTTGEIVTQKRAIKWNQNKSLSTATSAEAHATKRWSIYQVCLKFQWFICRNPLNFLASDATPAQPAYA
jgi:hypothetical protein